MILSPTFTKSGTATTAPVSSVAGFVTFETVSPFTPGSVSVTSSTTDDGRSTPEGSPPTNITCTLDDGCMNGNSSSISACGSEELLEGLLVHEHDLVARVIEVLHVLLLGAHARELLAGAEGVVDDRAVREAFQLRAHEGTALARLDVLELDECQVWPSSSMCMPLRNWLVETTSAMGGGV